MLAFVSKLSNEFDMIYVVIFTLLKNNWVKLSKIE